MGKPSVSQVWLNENGTVERGRLSSVSADAKSQLVSASALARNSSHPLSHAIAEALKGSEISALTSTEVRGSGVEAQSVNGLLRLGSLKWLKDTNVDTSPAEDFVKSATGSGATVVGFANNQILEAIFAIRDELKSGAADVIRNLQGEGL